MAERLGEILVQLGAVRPEDVARALRVQQERGGRIGALLMQQGAVDEDTLLKALARQKRVPFAEARWFEQVEPRIVRLMQRNAAVKHRLIPLRLMDKRLVVATSDADNLDRVTELSRELGHSIRPVLARRVDIERALGRYYGLEDAPQPEVNTSSEVQLLVRRKDNGTRSSARLPVAQPTVQTTLAPGAIATPRAPSLPPTPVPPPPPAEDLFSAEEDAELRELFASADHVSAPAGSPVNKASGADAFAEDARTTLDLRPPSGMVTLKGGVRRGPPPPPPSNTPSSVSIPVGRPPAGAAAMEHSGLRARPAAARPLPPAPPPPPPPTPAPPQPPPMPVVNAEPVDPVTADMEAVNGEGQKFGAYTLVSRVKAGGMAEVYLAKTGGVEGFEKQVAIKRILPHLTESSEFVEMFIDEAKLTVQLNHANIAHIYDFGKRDNSYYIAMEFIHGKDVNAIFREAYRQKTPLPLSVCCFIVQQACEGLDYAHRKKSPEGRDLGIVHRDISPANILVSYEGAVKIIDFGIAKAVSKLSMTRPGLIKGKISYMSPEQMRGQSIDRRSDVFALGIILYELLTAKRLFAAKTDVDTIRNVIKGNIPALESVRPDIPPELAGIVMKALQREADTRYGWAADMSVDLQTFMLRAGIKDPRGELSRYMDQVMRHAE